MPSHPYRKNPQVCHTRPEHGRITYLSQDDFGPLQGSSLFPKLADFNLTVPGLPGGLGHVFAIQSHRFRGPEVLLGCAWSYSADIWNFGLFLWNLLEDTSLFDRPAGEDGEYDAHIHLAQIASLLGEPPEELIKRERLFRELHLKAPILDLRGKECRTMNEFWGGPFFANDNQMFRRDLLTGGKSLADAVTELAGDEKKKFLDLASSILQWLPKKRKTAKELLSHPFFEEIRNDRDRHQSG
ncbi:uncharacterized protein E0L32_005005 [Thyridium curvatum]|uniref:Protein kinase domain-containing protein n=1 Tax=Thyridium curvatum TaxID=1093900 RepID=A0A507B6Y9_9PEZI|nr:uncharacterized protein E0L32_005005 [Thyridium curvatum]TPX14896.1 hypothetical protein E0L32_005005 [Thyridium curvatum]